MSQYEMIDLLSTTLGYSKHRQIQDQLNEIIDLIELAEREKEE